MNKINKLTKLILLITIFVISKLYGQVNNLVYSTTVLNDNSPELNINTALPVAAITGEGSVNISGAATYSIPIGVPPGTANMVPNLSIVYNSHSGNGLLGLGWDLAGLSAVSRIPQNYYINNNCTSVDFSANDRFALDGNRLVIKTGNYGDNGAEYFTENETFAKITSLGQSGNGPTYFTVKNIDGTTIEYGNTTDSRFIPLGSNSVLVWKINKIIDRFGNYVKFNYTAIDNEHVISSIEYTGNANANLLPYNKIEFEYNYKTDKPFYFLGNVKLNQKLVLKKIKVFAEQNSIRDEYTFEYIFDNIINATKLQEIKQKVNNQVDINSTKIIWGSNGEEVERTILGDFANQQNNDRTETKTGDFNGDGKSDIIIIRGRQDYIEQSNGQLEKRFIPTYYSFKLGNGNGFTSIGYGELNSSYSLSDFWVEDIDNDGIDEVIIDYTEDYHDRHYINFFKINSNFNLELLTLLPNENNFVFIKKTRVQFGDFNGDGKKDILLIKTDLSSENDYNEIIRDCFMSQPNNTFIRSYFYFGFNPGIKNMITLLDFNGNGKTDIMFSDPNRSQIIEFNHPNVPNYTQLYYSGFPLFNLTCNNCGHKFQVGDFNGDGKSDILFKSSDINNWQIAYSTGSVFSSPSTQINNISGDISLNVVDINSDGKSDIVHKNYSNIENFY